MHYELEAGLTSRRHWTRSRRRLWQCQFLLAVRNRAGRNTRVARARFDFGRPATQRRRRHPVRSACGGLPQRRRLVGSGRSRRVRRRRRLQRSRLNEIALTLAGSATFSTGSTISVRLLVRMRASAARRTRVGATLVNDAPATALATDLGAPATYLLPTVRACTAAGTLRKRRLSLPRRALQSLQAVRYVDGYCPVGATTG